MINNKQNSKYITGDEFTMADVIFFPQLAFCVRVGYPLEKLPKLSNMLLISITVKILGISIKIFFSILKKRIMIWSKSANPSRIHGHRIGKTRTMRIT
jgi:hypothetical protein